MNARKLYAFAVATLISAAGFGGIAAYADASVHAALRHMDATADNIRTLPAVTVRPTRDELRRARGEPATENGGSAGTAGPDIGMPYYSFAADHHVGSR